MKKYAVLAASFIFLMVSFYVLAPGFRRLGGLNTRVARLKATKYHLEKENKELTATLQALENDFLYIEMRARQKLGLKKPGEVIYRIRPPRYQDSGTSSTSAGHSLAEGLGAPRPETPAN